MEELEAQVSDYDLDLYLAQNTLILYGDLQRKGGYPKEFSYEDQLRKKAYVYLHKRVCEFVENGGELELLGPPSISKKKVLSGCNSGCARTQALRPELPARLYHPDIIAVSWLRPGASGATPSRCDTPGASGGLPLHLVHQKTPGVSTHQGYLLGDRLVLS